LVGQPLAGIRSRMFLIQSPLYPCRLLPAMRGISPTTHQMRVLS
jgi:hypothetical protein